MDGLTTVQCGAHLFLQILKSGAAFGNYLRRMLEPHEAGGQVRQRSVLPLPLKDDSKSELLKLMKSEEYKRLAGTWKDKKAAGASRTKKEVRKVGLLVWHGLMTATRPLISCGMGVAAMGESAQVPHLVGSNCASGRPPRYLWTMCLRPRRNL